jgi:hypothetical protein
VGRRAARDVTEAQAESILNAVLDAGINYIDTSIDYGLSEERIGRYIAHRRAEFYLASKCGCLVGATPAPPGQRNAHVFTRENIVKGVEQSLARMKTDYLDVVQFHASPSKETLEEHGALDALLELKEAGKVRFVGISATLPHLSDHIATSVFDVFQIPYSAVEREHEAGDRRGCRSRGGDRRPRWCGERWALRREAERMAMGPLAPGTARRPARGHKPDGVHSPLYIHQPGSGYDNRRHGEPGAPAVKPRRRAAGTATARSLRRGQAPSRCRRIGAAQRPPTIDGPD